MASLCFVRRLSAKLLNSSHSPVPVTWVLGIPKIVLVRTDSEIILSKTPRLDDLTTVKPFVEEFLKLGLPDCHLEESELP